VDVDAEVGSDGLTELRKLGCRLQERISCGKAGSAPTDEALTKIKSGGSKEPIKIAPALGMGGPKERRTIAESGFPSAARSCFNHIASTKRLNQIGFRGTPIEAQALHQN
jgi:hypothetical protein